MRTFKLYRKEDATGISGTGYIAEGAVFSNGNAVLNWLTTHQSIGLYPSIEELVSIHGHEGRTMVVWDGGKDE